MLRPYRGEPSPNRVPAGVHGQVCSRRRVAAQLADAVRWLMV